MLTSYPKLAKHIATNNNKIQSFNIKCIIMHCANNYIIFIKYATIIDMHYMINKGLLLV